MNPTNPMAETPHCDDAVVVPVILEHPQVQVSLRMRPSEDNESASLLDGFVLRFYKNHDLTIPIGRSF